MEPITGADGVAAAKAYRAEKRAAGPHYVHRGTNGEYRAQWADFSAPYRKPSKWRAPSRKAFTPTGITLGAEVTTRSHSRGAVIRPRSGCLYSVTFDSPITGQVWSEADGTILGSRRTRAYWVVADDGSAYAVDARDLVVIGQCNDGGDVPLDGLDVA